VNVALGRLSLDDMSEQPTREASGFLPCNLGNLPMRPHGMVRHLDGNGGLVAAEIADSPGILLDVDVLGNTAMSIDVKVG